MNIKIYSNKEHSGFLWGHWLNPNNQDAPDDHEISSKPIADFEFDVPICDDDPYSSVLRVFLLRSIGDASHYSHCSDEEILERVQRLLGTDVWTVAL